jgi:hypothetical protein
MMRFLMLVPALLLAAAPVSAAPVTLEMEDTDGFFEDLPGASADAVNGNCLACHSAGMIRYQPALSPDQWQKTLTKMRSLYKAPLDRSDDAAILAWLNAYSASQKTR